MTTRMRVFILTMKGSNELGEIKKEQNQKLYHQKVKINILHMTSFVILIALISP